MTGGKRSCRLCSSQVKRSTDFGRTCERHRQAHTKCGVVLAAHFPVATGSFERQESVLRQAFAERRHLCRVSGEDRLHTSVQSGRVDCGFGTGEGWWSGVWWKACCRHPRRVARQAGHTGLCRAPPSEKSCAKGLTSHMEYICVCAARQVG